MKYVIYTALAVVLHMPFDCPLALLPFIPQQESPVVMTE